MEIVYRKLSELKTNPKNPRKGTKEAIEKLAESIKGNPKFFEARPILLSDRTGQLVIIGGERRSEAAALLKMQTVPTILLSGLTEAQEDEILIKDNTHAGVWDEQKLQAWGKDQLQSWNVDDVKWPKEQPQVKEDDFDPDKKVKSRVKPGELWQLGKHRLLCGDSTDAEQVASLMGEAKIIDLCLTDPPYGISIVKKNKKIGGDKAFGTTHGASNDAILKATEYAPIKGDETTDTAKMNYEIMKTVSRNQILFGGNYFTDFLVPKSCWIVWDKQNSGSFADVELAWSSFDKGAKLYSFMWNGLIRAGKRDIEGVKRVHPTQKPVGLIGMILEDFTKEGQTVIDPFCGSGSILMACEQLNRICYGMEYEPHYCDVIIARWEQFTGKKAKKIE